MIALGYMLFWLVVVHFLCDYPLQGDFLAQGKNRHTDLGKIFWPHALTAHSAIQAGGVALVTGSVALGLTEFVIHWLTDWLKCEKRISLNADQGIHLSCKVLYVLILSGWNVWSVTAMSATAAIILLLLQFTLFGLRRRSGTEGSKS